MTAKRADDLLTAGCIALIILELWLPGYSLYWLGGAGMLMVVWLTLVLRKTFGN